MKPAVLAVPIELEDPQPRATIDSLGDELLSLCFRDLPFPERVALAWVARRWRRLLAEPGEHWHAMDIHLDLAGPDAGIEAVQAWLAEGRGSLTRRLRVSVVTLGRAYLVQPSLSLDGWMRLFPGLHDLRLELPPLSAAVTPATLDLIGLHMPQLRSLAIRCRACLNVDPAAAPELARLTALEALAVDGWWPSIPPWLQQATSLRRLDLMLESVGGSAAPSTGLVDALSRLSRLSQLHLGVTWDRPAMLLWGTGELPPSLAAFGLSSREALDGDGVQTILSGMWPKLAQLPRLSTLQLSGFKFGIQRELEAHLSTLRGLTALRVASKGLWSLPEGLAALQHLRMLDVRGSPWLTEFAWAALAQLRELEDVNLIRTGFRGPEAGDFQALACLPRLQRIAWSSPPERASPEEMARIEAAAEAFDAAYADCHREEAGGADFTSPLVGD